MTSFRFCEAERRVFAHRAPLGVAAWAAKHLIVQDGLYRGSPLRLDVSPFLAGPMDSFSSPLVREVIVCGSLQVGKTLFLYACLGWSMDYRPGVKMLTMPTKDALQRVAEKKLCPLLQGSPLLRRLVSKYRLTNIVLRDGTSIELASAESPGQRASVTVQDLFVDEEDLYGGAGQSKALEDFKGRTRSYGDFAKVARACQIKGGEESSIWQGLISADQTYCYEAVCPACRRPQPLDAANVVVPDGETDPRLIRSRRLARYRCAHCGYGWSDHARDLAVAAGQWRPYRWTGASFESAVAVPDAAVVGYHMPALLSRMVSLSDIATRRIKAETSDKPEDKRQHYNDDLALPYSQTEIQTDAERLAELRDMALPPLTVPHGALALTCGIDVQKRGCWYLVRAWMPSLSSYVIDYGYLPEWDDVLRLVFEAWYPVQGPAGEETGERMSIWRAGIDSGGTETEGVYTRTEEVYNFVRACGAGVIHAVKGASRPQVMPVRWVLRERMPHNGRPIPGGLRLYLLDTGVFKTLDFGRMLNPDSKQPLRFHAGADEMLFRHLSAERQVRKNDRLIWEQTSRENHLLDCLMISSACADASWTPSLPLYALQLRDQQGGRDRQAASHSFAPDPTRLLARPHSRSHAEGAAPKTSRWG